VIDDQLVIVQLQLTQVNHARESTQVLKSIK
jgi:hypothetical protein